MRSAVELTLADDYWVEAELAEVRERGGHCYMELVQKNADGATTVARASAKCWRSAWSLVRPHFERVTGEPLHAGMKVLMERPALFNTALKFAPLVNKMPRSFIYNRLNAWGEGRELPTFAKESFNEMWKNNKIKK